MRSATTQPVRPLGADGIDLRLLRYFLAVAEERHFGRAAKRLHISQPPLSQAIRKLEGQLGVELFRRGSGGIVTTEAGKTFAVEARKVLAGVDVAIAEARRAGGAGAALRVGAAGHVGLEPLHRFIEALRERRAITQADVARLPSVEQLRRLRDGRLDLGIFPEHENEDGLKTAPFLPEEPLAAYMAPEHPLAANDAVTPGDLFRERVLVLASANPPLWETVRKRFERVGYRFELLDELAGANDSRDALLAASTGRGVVLLPASMLEHLHARTLVAMRPLDPPVSMPRTVIAWRADPSPHLARTIGTVREVASDLSNGRQ
jgi:DNA-binding transcriptional LysR family regulator